MPRVAVALLLTLVVLPVSAGAAGHDVSAVRYAPSGFTVGPSVMAANGSRFLTVWSGYGDTLAYGAVTETANGVSSMPFLLPGVAFAGDTIRVRAYGPDGITPDAAITTVHSEPRTRTVRR